MADGYRIESDPGERRRLVIGPAGDAAPNEEAIRTRAADDMCLGPGRRRRIETNAAGKRQRAGLVHDPGQRQPAVSGGVIVPARLDGVMPSPIGAWAAGRSCRRLGDNSVANIGVGYGPRGPRIEVDARARGGQWLVKAEAERRPEFGTGAERDKARHARKLGEFDSAPAGGHGEQGREPRRRDIDRVSRLED